MHAALGTAAHKLLELSVTARKPPERWHGKDVLGFAVDDEMVEAVTVAYDHIMGWIKKHKTGHHRVEYHLDIPLGPRKIEGTLDFTGYSQRDDLLDVIDYKHGAGVFVSEEDNEQIGLYTIGVIARLPKPPKHIRQTIIQPRAIHHGAKPVRPYSTTWDKLVTLRSRAVEALAAAEEPGIPRTAGTHCRFCPVAATCRELAEYNLRNAVKDFEDITQRPVVDPKDPATLNADGLAYVLQQMPVLKAWASAVEAEALRRLQQHQPVPQFKLVAGRSYRVWASAARVRQALAKSSLTEDQYAPRELLGPSPILKLAKGDAVLTKKLQAQVTKTRPSLTVAPESDARRAISGAASLDFNPVDTDNEPIGGREI